jgi:dTDP-glucose 4,6-dehydratase
LKILDIILDKLNRSKDLIEFVQDRPGHDRRYSIDCSKIKKELGYDPKFSIVDGLDLTIRSFIK